MHIYRVTITGTQPLLMHADNIEWADTMEKWKSDKDNRKLSKAGDDRTPAFRWIGSLYRDDGGTIIIPTENIMRCLMEGGAMVLVPGAKGNKTFKSQSQSGIMPRAIGWPLLLNGKPINTAPIKALLAEKNFDAHQEAARAMGFSLFIKRARIGTSKHIRVRPRFEAWAVQGELVVIDEQITKDVLSDILDIAGRFKGLGDWRPGGKTPGSFGTFTAQIEQVQ